MIVRSNIQVQKGFLSKGQLPIYVTGSMWPNAIFEIKEAWEDNKLVLIFDTFRHPETYKKVSWQWELHSVAEDSKARCSVFFAEKDSEGLLFKLGHTWYALIPIKRLVIIRVALDDGDHYIALEDETKKIYYNFPKIQNRIIDMPKIRGIGRLEYAFSNYDPTIEYEEIIPGLHDPDEEDDED